MGNNGFALEMLTGLEHLPYPRLIVDKGLTGPAPIDTSVATLWLWAPESCEITLDNTPDRELQETIFFHIAKLMRNKTTSQWLLEKATAS